MESRRVERRVLLLDDDVSHASELARALGSRAWEVTVLDDAEKGFSTATTDHFDLILLSVELSGAKGFELCKRIKNDPVAASVPLFMISNDAHAHAERNGAVGFLKKPVAVGDLLAQLDASPVSLPPEE